MSKKYIATIPIPPKKKVVEEARHPSMMTDAELRWEVELVLRKLRAVLLDSVPVIEEAVERAVREAGLEPFRPDTHDEMLEEFLRRHGEKASEWH